MDLADLRYGHNQEEDKEQVQIGKFYSFGNQKPPTVENSSQSSFLNFSEMKKAVTLKAPKEAFRLQFDPPQKTPTIPHNEVNEPIDSDRRFDTERQLLVTEDSETERSKVPKSPVQEVDQSSLQSTFSNLYLS